jgi:hypothetical protein
MLADLAALAPPLIVAGAFVTGLVMFLRRQMAPRSQECAAGQGRAAGDRGDAAVEAGLPANAEDRAPQTGPGTTGQAAAPGHGTTGQAAAPGRGTTGHITPGPAPSGHRAPGPGATRASSVPHCPPEGHPHRPAGPGRPSRAPGPR